jgi:hypothetical protein
MNEAALTVLNLDTRGKSKHCRTLVEENPTFDVACPDLHDHLRNPAACSSPVNVSILFGIILLSVL